MANKVANLSADAINVLKTLKDGSATVADLKVKGLTNVNSAQLKALETRGLVTAETVEREFVVTIKRKVKNYTVTDAGMDYKTE